MGPVTNYGYSNQVTLLSRIKVPDNIAAGGAFPVKAKVKWLVCEEECIPQEVDLALDLPVVLPGADTGPRQSADRNGSRRFAGGKPLADKPSAWRQRLSIAN